MANSRGERVRTAGAVLVTSLALVAVFADAPARWLVVRDPPRAVDAALVMAGDPHYERTRTASRLVVEGRARLLIVTGGEPGPGDSARSLRAAALAFGVAADAIREERASHSTREAMVAVRPILESEGVRSVVLVTSPYHQRRTFWAARRALGSLALYNHPAEPSFWSPEGWWKERRTRRIVLSEYLKLGYYMLRGWA